MFEMSADDRYPGARRLTEREVASFIFAFILSHEECGEEMELHCESGYLFCYCGCCGTLRTRLLATG